MCRSSESSLMRTIADFRPRCPAFALLGACDCSPKSDCPIPGHAASPESRSDCKRKGPRRAARSPRGTARCGGAVGAAEVTPRVVGAGCGLRAGRIAGTITAQTALECRGGRGGWPRADGDGKTACATRIPHQRDAKGDAMGLHSSLLGLALVGQPPGRRYLTRGRQSKKNSNSGLRA